MWDYLDGIKEQTEERPNLILMFHSGLFRFMGYTIGDKLSHLPVTINLNTDFFKDFLRFKLLYSPAAAELGPVFTPVSFLSHLPKLLKCLCNRQTVVCESVYEIQICPLLIVTQSVPGQGVSLVARPNSI